VALAVIVPIILFPALFVWYLNLGGLYARMRRALRERRDAMLLLDHPERAGGLLKPGQVVSTSPRK